MEERGNCITQVVKARLQCVVIGAVSQKCHVREQRKQQQQKSAEFTNRSSSDVIVEVSVTKDCPPGRTCEKSRAQHPRTPSTATKVAGVLLSLQSSSLSSSS